ncbi:MAG: VWA domain-containing protein [Acidobacteria bacterium]|nr:VWA domain-containing protein [Acidobacteriota bacterium]
MRGFSYLIILFLLCSLTAPLLSSANTLQEKPTGSGQSPAKPKPPQQPAEDQDEAVRLTSKLVVVPVSVSDANGQPVKDLKVDDIEIDEEGRPQKVVALGEPGKTPVEIALLFDVSGSVQGKFAFEQQAAVQFIKEVLQPSDAVSVFSIGVTPKLMQTRTTSGTDAVSGIMAIAPLKEPTAFFDTVVDAARYLDKTAAPGSRRVVVVISDGEENYSQRSSLHDALKELQKNDCLFYAINPSGGGIKLNVISTKGQGFMDAMATQTGGKAFNLARIEDLEAVFRQITAELQAQYLFGYYSSDERNEAGFRRITVRAPKRSDLRIRARQGYYVTKS